MLRWRLHTRWSWWKARTFGYRGQILVGRDVPNVDECHDQHQPGHSCPQHDGMHFHHWVRCVVTDKLGAHPQDATRCTICGGRKCDMPGCLALRHHRGEHVGAALRNGGVVHGKPYWIHG